MRLIPMSRRFRMLVAGLAAAAVLLWALSITGPWWHESDHLSGLINDAAVTSTLLAAIILAVHMRSEKEKAMLLRALVNANRPGEPVRTTRPLQRVV